MSRALASLSAAVGSEKSREIPRAATDMRGVRKRRRNLIQPDANVPAEEIFTGSEAAKRLGMPLTTLRRLVRDGTLWAASMENGAVGLRESEIQRFSDQSETLAQVELANPKSIEASLRTAPTARSPRCRTKNSVNNAPKSTQRCRCGSCPACLDSARWERIFQEKFADPDYYARREPRHGSSLSWLL